MQSHTFVPLFPGQGSSSAALSLALNQALRDSRSPSAQLLLASCHEAFHLELSKLSENELNQSCISLLDFQEATSLLSPSGVYQNNPIISSTSLFLVQALRYLAHCSAEPNSRGPFPDHRLGVLGYSSGIVTACVVGASNSVLTFVSNAVEAFRLAFWIGLRSIQHKTKELQSALVFPDTTLPWTVVCIGLNRSDVLGFISDFETKHDCIASLHLTAILDTQHVTISGRPDILQRFSSSIGISKSCIIHPTTTDALYHAHTLRSVRAQVLADVGNHLIRFPDFSDLKYPVFSTISGKPVVQDSEHSSLVDAVLDMIIASPVDWMSVVQGLGSAAPSDAPTQVLNFGPSSGLLRMLEKSLPADKIICRDVTVCDSSSPDAATGHTFKQEPIAIVGMALRLPGGARNANELWELLERGINTISEIPADRFQLERYTSADAKSGRGMKVHTGNFIDRPDEFDYKFFKVSPREAKSMDPQQRILLHTAHDALENAGYVPDATPSFQRDTFGCFIGTATHDYADNLREDIDVHYSTGTLKAFLSGRISYAMQLGGPSMTLDTACSSSIVALHQACRALVNGDCNAAIAGGVNVMSSPDMFIGLDHGHFLSSTGQCKSFDASADGYSRSEGCSLFVLKRLSDAVAENDDILGVIRGIDINQSGLAHSITHPHIPSQVALMNRLLKNAGVDASRVSVVEAHGTGTQAGDFSELQSIRAVLCRARDVSNPLHVTSIKANIGHLEAASGAAGLAKLLLMFQHDTIPAQISLKTLNPRITPLAQDNTVIDTLPSPWVRGSSPRMALLNNFGASGSNGALIVEEYTRQAKAPASGTSYVFGISAKTREVLETLRVRYFQWLHDGRNRSVPMSDIAYTATARRQLYPYRISVDVVSKEQLVQGLASAEMTHCEGNPGQVVFVFSGQGSYYRGMGKLLYSSSPVFQRCIDRCHRYLMSKGFADILPSIIGGVMDSADGMEEFEASQTATFALEVALATLWIHWGLTPAVVVGHSLGEYAALVIAEVISLEAALFLVASRARLTWRSCASGTTGMLAIRLGEQQIKPILKNTSYADLSVACVNSDRACVVSGPLSQLEALTGELAATGSKARLLDVPYGYHSQAMDPVLDDLTQLARTVPLGCPKVAVGSTVLGRLVPVGDSATFDATYFATHFRQPVLFAPTVDALCKHPSLPQIDAWIEMGPQASCLLMIKACASAPSEAALLPSLSKNDNATLASSLSQLYRTSAPLNWRNVFEEVAPGTCADLPPYPLETHKIWVPYKEPFLPSLETLKSKVPALAPASPPARRTAPAPARTTAPPAPARSLAPPQIITQANLISDYTFLRAWVQYPSRENGNAASFDTPIEVLAPYIQGHKVAEHCLCPASIYLEQVLSGADLSRRHLGFDFGKSMAVLRGVHFAKPLVYHPQVNRVVRTHVTIHEDGTGFFTITSRLQSSLDESVHVRGEIRFQSIRETTASLDSEFRLIPRLSAEEIGSRKEGQAEIFSTRTLYEVVFPRVVEYSAKYHTIQTLTASADGMDGIAQVKIPSDGPRLSFAAHPIFTDTLLHTAGFLANMQGDVSDAYICSEIESFKMLSEYIDQDQSYTVHCRGSWMSFDNIVLTEAYAVQDQEPRRVVALMKGIQFKRVRLSGLARGLATAADSASAQTRTRTDSNAITPHATPQGIIFGRSRSSTESTGGVQISNSGNSSRPSSPETLVSDDDRRIRIRDIIAQVLGLATLDIEDHSDFKSLGLDSLSSLEALHALKTELGVDLPHDAFETYSTIISLNAFLDKSSGSSLQKIVERAPQKSLERSHASPARSVASTVTVSGDDRRIRIRGIIAEVLGLSISDVEDDSDFKSLGLDSLSSLEALHALKTELGVDLPHDAFESHSTIASLNASLDKSSSPQKSVERAPQKPVERSHTSPAKSVALTVTVSDDDRGIRIRGIIAEVLGLPISDVEDDADFKSLGLDSLSSLEALHAFKTELSVDLPHDAFETYSTIASLNTSLNTSSSPKKSSGRSGPSTKTLQPASFDTRMSRLQFSKDDIAVPLLLIHDGSGLINHYNRVMPLHRDVFALSNPCLITGGKWESVEQMAESYANVVLGAKSDQIIIGGWSFGGVVAFETAKRLVQHGVRVNGIVLIDSPCPGKHVPLSSSVIDHVTKAHSKGIDSGTLNLVAEQFKESSRLLSVYNPSREGKLEVPVVLLRSSEGYAPPGLNVPDWLQHRGSEGAVVSEWEAFTRSPVKTWSIPGDHFGPFNPENIEQTSQQLKDACHYVERL